MIESAKMPQPIPLTLKDPFKVLLQPYCLKRLYRKMHGTFENATASSLAQLPHSLYLISKNHVPCTSPLQTTNVSEMKLYETYFTLSHWTPIQHCILS